MQSVTFQLDADELDNRFVESVQSLFRGSRITVTIEPQVKQITSPDLLEKIERNLASGISYTVPGEEFTRLTDQFFADDSFDLINAIRAYKQTTS